MPLSKDARYRVFAGLTTRSIEFAPRELISRMLLITAVLLGIAFVLAWVIAGRSFRPIERMVDQVEAISDGRSLHRRLNIGAAGQELARLATTLNEMIERLDKAAPAGQKCPSDGSFVKGDSK